MTEQTPQPKATILPKMEIPTDLELVYANLVRIVHSPMDLVFDFAQLLPGGEAQVRSRIVMSPSSAKMLLHALADNLNKFEASYGEIRLPGDNSLANYLFRPPDPDRK